MNATNRLSTRKPQYQKKGRGPDLPVANPPSLFRSDCPEELVEAAHKVLNFRRATVGLLLAPAPTGSPSATIITGVNQVR